MPNLTADLVDQLAAHHGADVVLPWDGRDHYLAAIYRTGLTERIDVLVDAGHRSMRSLISTVVTERVVLPPGDALTNVNAPSDLRH
jgi:molybdopterin-guanine dinucleotide biosynthesis protein A